MLIDEFLVGEDLTGKHILDAGHRTGRGTEWMISREARVTARDIGANPVSLTRLCYFGLAPVASVIDLPIPDDIFSTEGIEHTPDLFVSAREMNRVLKPNEHLFLSTPCWLWQ